MEEAPDNRNEKEIVTDWLVRNKDVLSLKALEEKIGCPSGTLAKAVNKNRPLPWKWSPILFKFIKKEMALV